MKSIFRPCQGTGSDEFLQWSTEPGKYRTYWTGPNHTEPNLTAYKFSIIPSLKGSKNFEILKIKWFLKNIPEIWPKIAQIA